MEDKEKKEARCEKEENNKRLALWAGIIFFTILIGLLWFFNTKSFLIGLKYEKREKTVDIDAVTTEFQKSFSDLNSRLKDLKAIEKSAEELPPIATSTEVK